MVKKGESLGNVDQKKKKIELLLTVSKKFISSPVKNTTIVLFDLNETLTFLISGFTKISI
jgi:hypothetical protein